MFCELVDCRVVEQMQGLRRDNRFVPGDAVGIHRRQIEVL
jgi:hypothetical protein